MLLVVPPNKYNHFVAATALSVNRVMAFISYIIYHISSWVFVLSGNQLKSFTIYSLMSRFCYSMNIDMINFERYVTL
ncbi:MAG: hypothetical protein ACI843_000083 [Psychrobacter glaciei]|jgi:hypothetical protein